MSVFHNLQIAPKSNTIITLKDLDALIVRLQEGKLIEQEITLLTGKQEDVRKASFWDFEDHTPQSKLVSDSKLSILNATPIASLDPGANYAFKVHLSKTNEVFAELEVFINTDREDFPLFIIYVSDPISFIITKEDMEEGDLQDIKLTNINCIITSSGRNEESLYELGENPEGYEPFYKEIKSAFGEFEIGSYID